MNVKHHVYFTHQQDQNADTLHVVIVGGNMKGRVLSLQQIVHVGAPLDGQDLFYASEN